MTKNIRGISPYELKKEKLFLPDPVIISFNNLLKKSFKEKTHIAFLLKTMLLEELRKFYPHLSDEELVKNGFLNLNSINGIYGNDWEVIEDENSFIFKEKLILSAADI